MKRMEQFNKLISLLVFLISLKVNAQKYITYSQENSIQFSNKYVLDTISKTFEHKYQTDDGQLWYGRGSYYIENNKIFFNFKNAPSNNIVIIKTYEEEVNDTIKLIFFDENKQSMPTYIKINGEKKGTDFYDFINLERRSLNDNDRIIFFNNGEEFEIHLDNIVNLSLIEVFNLLFAQRVYYESNFTRVLVYKDALIISPDFYNTSKKSKVKFIKQSD